MPAVDSGRARKILVDPNNSSRIFLLTSGGGLWKTDNVKLNKPVWTALSDSVGVAGGEWLSDERQIPSTSEPAIPLITAPAASSKSTNGGRSWGANVTLTGATRITDVKVDTSNPAADVVLVGTDFGLFRSADSGATFTKVTSANLSDSV